MLDVNHSGQDYTLSWPRELFVQEARALLAGESSSDGVPPGQVEWLLEEAFASSAPVADYRSSTGRASWDQLAAGGTTHKPFLQGLVEAASRLPELTAPRPYYAARHNLQLVARDRRPDPTEARRDWMAAVTALRQRGYLAHVAPKICVDGGPYDPDPEDAMDSAIADRLGISGLWRDRAATDWDDVTFYSLVEVLHDLVERPRTRWDHPYGNCGYHYSDFALYPAQVLYRWTVNRILARHGIDLVLAKNGEDVGRLVHQPTDGRVALMDAALATNDTAVRPTLEHAVSLFRSRTAIRENKRSACITLAGLLEERRGLIKEQLLKKDEGALFQIANEFAVRHRNANQRSDYDEEYLDWLFWWYLATIDLTTKLLTRQKPTTT